MALPLLGRSDPTLPSTDTADVVTALVWQILTGAALGFLCYLIFAAVQTAGDLIDVSGASRSASSTTRRRQRQRRSWAGSTRCPPLTLLLASGGYLIVLQGFLASFRALPLDGGLDIGSVSRGDHGRDIRMLVAAAQIAGPLIVVLFLADIGLGLLTRIAPALNAFSLSFPLKILLTLLVVGAALVTLPNIVSGLVGDVMTTFGHLMVRQ